MAILIIDPKKNIPTYVCTKCNNDKFFVRKNTIGKLGTGFILTCTKCGDGLTVRDES